MPCFIDTTVSTTIDKWKELSRSPPPEAECRHLQRSLDNPFLIIRRDELVKYFDHSSRLLATYKASCQKDASAWLCALPSASVGNYLEDDVLRISAGIRLGFPSVSHTSVNIVKLMLTNLEPMANTASPVRTPGHSWIPQ